MEGGRRRVLGILSIVVILIVIKGVIVKSEVYTVGDEEEWNTGVNYLKWSQKYNFTIGDVLVFKYLMGQHNVYEVTEATYQSCNSSSGVLKMYENGNDEVNLTQAKKYNFICDKEGHCLGGMRFIINVKLANNDYNYNYNNTTSSPPLDPNSCYYAYNNRPQMGMYLFIAFLVLLKLYY